MCAYGTDQEVCPSGVFARNGTVPVAPAILSHPVPAKASAAPPKLRHASKCVQPLRKRAPSFLNLGTKSECVIDTEQRHREWVYYRY